MSLAFVYDINTGNRFYDLLDHDEDGEELIAKQKEAADKSKRPTKDTKSTAKTSAKKTTSKTSSTPATTTSSSNTKSNKENVTSIAANADQQQQVQSKNAADNENQRQQSARTEGGRGGRGFPRRGGSAGYDRPPYDGGYRGSGQQRSQRFHKFEGQTHEISGFEQSANNWSNEPGNDQQPSSGYYSRGRGRGRGYVQGRGRGGRGRGYFNNRAREEGSQEQQQLETTSGFQQSADSNFDSAQTQSIQPTAQEFDADGVLMERPFQADSTRRGRGRFGPRIFRNSRNFGADRENQEDGNYENFRQTRRQHDRQPRSATSTVKAIEKKNGNGSHNYGNRTENPEEVEPVVDTTDAVEQPAGPSPASKNWAKQVDEAEELMTLDEYKKKKEAEKQAHQEKLPQFNRRAANEGEDPKTWKNFNLKYQKKTDEESGDEEEEASDEEEDEEESTGKKKIITIPLHFTPVDRPRGTGESRGGLRRGGSGFAGGRYRDQQRSHSPNQQVPHSEQAGENQSDQQQSRPYRGGARQGSGRGEYRRSYGNSTRGSRGGFNRSNADPNAPDFANTKDFPTLSDAKK